MPFVASRALGQEPLEITTAWGMRDLRPGMAYTLCHSLQCDRFEPGYAATVAQDYTRRHPYISKVEAWLAPHLRERPLILDWGGGDGSNTPFLGQGQVFVHDISGAALAEGAERADTHARQRYDLLREMQPLMDLRTMLYVEGPHEALVRQHPPGTDLTPHKRHWHEHVNFFTESSLRQLTARAGLRVTDTLRLPVNNGARQGEVLGLLLTKGCDS
jgi:hypothetical protein